MLIRIVPDLFTDKKFECVTLSDVKKEFFGTTKFKIKYPWRDLFKGSIPILGNNTIDNDEIFKLSFRAIKLSLDSGVVNKTNSKFFGLSYVDQKIIACAEAFSYAILTEDKTLREYFIQELEGNCKSVLELLNDWLEKGLITWDEEKQAVTRDWVKDSESAQSAIEIKRFEKLTGLKYQGT